LAQLFHGLDRFVFVLVVQIHYGLLQPLTLWTVACIVPVVEPTKATTPRATGFFTASQKFERWRLVKCAAFLLLVASALNSIDGAVKYGQEVLGLKLRSMLLAISASGMNHFALQMVLMDERVEALMWKTILLTISLPTKLPSLILLMAR